MPVVPFLAGFFGLGVFVGAGLVVFSALGEGSAPAVGTWSSAALGDTLPMAMLATQAATTAEVATITIASSTAPACRPRRRGGGGGFFFVYVVTRGGSPGSSVLIPPSPMSSAAPGRGVRELLSDQGSDLHVRNLDALIDSRPVDEIAHCQVLVLGNDHHRGARS